MAEWKEPYVAVEVITVTAPTNVVTFPRRYHPGQGDLVVYLNGFYAIAGREYTEITPYSIQFIDTLDNGDVVTGHYQKLW